MLKTISSRLFPSEKESGVSAYYLSPLQKDKEKKRIIGRSSLFEDNYKAAFHFLSLFLDWFWNFKVEGSCLMAHLLFESLLLRIQPYSTIGRCKHLFHSALSMCFCTGLYTVGGQPWVSFRICLEFRHIVPNLDWYLGLYINST